MSEKLSLDPRVDPKSFRYWWGKWQVKLSLILACFNIELIVIPFILIPIFQLTGLVLRVTSGIWATCEMAWWIPFSGWIQREVNKLEAVAEAVDLSREIKPEIIPEITEMMPEIRRTSSFKKIEGFLKDHSVGNFNLDNYQTNPLYLRLMSLLRASSYIFGCLLIFVLGCVPFIWIFGLMMCRATGWKMGYACLLIGNFIKNYYFAILWERYWYLKYSIYGTVIGSVLVLWLFPRIRRYVVLKARVVFIKK